MSEILEHGADAVRLAVLDDGKIALYLPTGADEAIVVMTPKETLDLMKDFNLCIEGALDILEADGFASYGPVGTA